MEAKLSTEPNANNIKLALDRYPEAKLMILRVHCKDENQAEVYFEHIKDTAGVKSYLILDKEDVYNFKDIPPISEYGADAERDHLFCLKEKPFSDKLQNHGYTQRPCPSTRPVYSKSSDGDVDFKII